MMKIVGPESQIEFQVRSPSKRKRLEKLSIISLPDSNTQRQMNMNARLVSQASW